jgi:hypothetical protein
MFVEGTTRRVQNGLRQPPAHVDLVRWTLSMPKMIFDRGLYLVPAPKFIDTCFFNTLLMV